MMRLSGSAGKRLPLTLMLLLVCRASLPCMAMQPPKSPLFDALKNNRTALTLELLAKGTDFRAVDDDGMSLLMWAVVMQNREVMNALLSHGANVDQKCSQGQTALMFCSMQHKTDTVFMKTLLDAKADLEIKDKQGQTALFYAVKYEQPELTKFLLDRGADLDARDNDFKDTVLSIAIGAGDAATVQLLLERGQTFI